MFLCRHTAISFLTFFGRNMFVHIPAKDEKDEIYEVSPGWKSNYFQLLLPNFFSFSRWAWFWPANKLILFRHFVWNFKLLIFEKRVSLLKSSQFFSQWEQGENRRKSNDVSRRRPIPTTGNSVDSATLRADNVYCAVFDWCGHWSLGESTERNFLISLCTKIGYLPKS